MLRSNRKSTPRVIKGRVQKKNNWSLSPDYYAAPQPRMVVIDRKRPGEGFKHFLAKSDIYRFLELLPDWDSLAVGLNAIVLDAGDEGLHGWHRSGVVAVCAWETELWQEFNARFYEEHCDIFERLGVQTELIEEYYTCKFEPNQIRAFQLLHILLHELGHHHDQMTTRSGKQASRGESYAEAYARQYEQKIWENYLRAFPL